VPTIIRNLPVQDTSSMIEVRGRQVRVLPFQAIVWVSIAAKGHPFDPRSPRIPAVVDLGYNGTFAIREESLHQWAGMDARSFHKLRTMQLRGAPTDQRLASAASHN